jgi:hypothetical protein
LGKRNHKDINKSCAATRVVFSDASSSGCGGFIVNINDSVCHRSWLKGEEKESSALRELMGVNTVLTSVPHLLSTHVVKWYTDNQSVVSIVQNGSMRPKLHEMALKIFSFSIEHSIKLDMEWIPRGENEKADQVSRIVDHDDWGISTEFFQCIESKWGPHTIDRFASHLNYKLKRFNSRFWTPGSEGVDAFAFDWRGENNLLVPPIYLIPRVIRYCVQIKANATIIVPAWRSAVFWPLLVNTKGSFKAFVSDYIKFDNVQGIFVQGSKKSIFNSEFRSAVYAIRLN